jgi:hypothetical protein
MRTLKQLTGGETKENLEKFSQVNQLLGEIRTEYFPEYKSGALLLLLPARFWGMNLSAS